MERQPPKMKKASRNDRLYSCGGRTRSSSSVVATSALPVATHGREVTATGVLHGEATSENEESQSRKTGFIVAEAGLEHATSRL